MNIGVVIAIVAVTLIVVGFLAARKGKIWGVKYGNEPRRKQ